MEASIHYIKKSIYPLMDSKVDLPCLDLFLITSETNKPSPQVKIAPLNNMCSELNYLNTQNGGFKPIRDQLESDFQHFSPENVDEIHQILKTIPIYARREMYGRKSLESAKLSSIDTQSEPSGYELTPFGYSDWNQWYEQQSKLPSNYGFEKGANLSPKSWSSLNTMIGSSSENSHPLHEENMMKSFYITNDFKRNYAEGSHTVLNMQMNTYASQAHAIGSILVPEGSSLYIPPGYIRVDTQKSSVRTTKQITNCEHVNRRHYAKGLCSTCYHKGGRTKLAWNCEHRDRLHYAKGCCSDCYNQFHSTRGKGKGKDQISPMSISNSFNRGNFNL